MTLRELADYKKNMDELKEFRAFGLTPYQMRLALDGANKAYNVHLFQKVEPMEEAPLPMNLYTDDSTCVSCGNKISAEGSWVCDDCKRKGKEYV